MKILITGGSGFLGRRAAAYLSSLGHAVLTPSHAQLDITDPSGVDAWFLRHRPETVVHCAAVSDTGVCRKNPEQTAKINVTGAANIAAASGRTGAKLIFCSSDQVYAGSKLPGPHRESEPLSPGNEYARQKLLAEQLCMDACPDAVCLRLSWMYSPDFLPGEHGHLAMTLLSALKDPSLPLTFPIYDRRGITDVGKVVHQLLQAFDLPGGVYNFGARNHEDTFHTLHAVFVRLKLNDALNRLEPNLAAFADSPRDIRMDGALAASYGIVFESTQDGLYRTLSALLK